MAAYEKTLTERAELLDRRKYVLSFDGTDDKVTIDHTGASPYFFDVNQVFTITLRIKLNTINNKDVLQFWNAALNSYTHTIDILDAKFRWRRDDAGNNPHLISSGVIEAGVWYFVTVGWDGSNAWIRVNGGTEYTVAVGNCDCSTYRIVLGENAAPGWFFGHIADFRAYNKTLTQDEITTLYNGGNVTDGLIDHWDFHEESGSTLGDVVGSNDGTITGATWVIVGQNLVKGLGKTLTEAVNFADIYSRVWNSVKTLTEAVNFADIYSRVWNSVKTLTEAVNFTDIPSKSWTLIRTLTEGIKMRDINNRSISRLLTDAISFVDAKAIFWKIFHGWRKKKSIDNTFWSRK